MARLSTVLYTTLLTTLPVALLAQDMTFDEDVMMLDEITVSTASGIATTVQDAPASITVIDQEMLAQEGARDLNDVLRQVPGLNLTRGNDGTSSVSFRGISSNRTLTLVDGKRVSTGKSFARHYQGDLNVVPIDAIERVEIVRGPMSTLYGSDAMGGVINIITKEAPGVWSGSVSTNFGFGEEATTGDSRQVSGYLSGPLSETVDVELWAKKSERDAPDAFTYTDENDVDQEVYGSEGSNSDELGARLSWRPNGEIEWGLEATAGHENYLAADGGDDTTKITRDSVALTNEWLLGNGSLSSYLRKETSSNAAWSGTEWNDPIEYDTLTFETRFSAETAVNGRSLAYTLGGTLAKDELVDPATNRDGALIAGEVVTGALYAEGRYDISDRLTVTGGLRYDHHENFGDHFTPRLYANYDLGSGYMLKAGYAQAFVAPDLRTLNPDYKMSSRGNGCKPYPGPCVIYGNPDIEPETSDNYEIGVNYQGGVLDWELTAFYNDITNMIGARKTGETDAGSGFDVFERTNLESGTTAGIEGGLSWEVSDTLTWTNSFTFLAKSEFRYEGLDHAFPMATTPKLNITTGANWRATDRFSLSGSATYVGKQVGYITEGELSDEEAQAVPAGQNSDPYVLVDVAASFNLTDNAKLNLGIDNLFDQQPADDTSYRENGRLFSIGLTTTF
ncbi:outer membrane receptor for ferrienterochelin and colicins [Pacificibacter maritimus]|uniref:Outer membrane receptor for ferrienterochelin and colicins n=1 Tax=Pacificibacter maritimus TaxID=762213 RepID=A0A3N4VBZ4_9RHOB|nr:TonB-dependent receptor [Pacificibacter maritimus]RPE71340.1 outer membrane receptor for ferrienterochelin and colicins [Pacificibacter maritimus]